MKPFNLEEYLENPSQKLVTGAGKNVRIICTDAKISAFYSIIALVEEPNGNESIVPYTKSGQFSTCNSSKENDLFFFPKKHERWINIYWDSDSDGEDDIFTGAYVYKSKEEAEKVGIESDNYRTTVKIEWEE